MGRLENVLRILLPRQDLVHPTYLLEEVRSYLEQSCKARPCELLDELYELTEKLILHQYVRGSFQRDFTYTYTQVVAGSSLTIRLS